MRILVVIGFFIVAVALVSWGTGLYPVALVDGEIILERTWAKARDGAISFANAQARAAGTAIVDFSSPEHADALREIRRGTLQFLIEDKIIERAGRAEYPVFQQIVRERVDEAVSGAENLEDAARTIYGLPLEDFKEFVLFPQGRRDFLNEELSRDDIEFDAWFEEKKKAAEVKLYFTDFKWNGETVE